MRIVKAFLIDYTMGMDRQKKRIVGNWKMHGDLEKAQLLLAALTSQSAQFPPQSEVIVCPPVVLLYRAAAMVSESILKIGAQDCSDRPEGAFTGDVSAPMIKEAGADYVIVGHSERRTHHGETSALVGRKAAAAIAAGLAPIICIGETLAEREAGKAEETVGKQVRESIPQEAGEGNFILAYEPVWAIGTGKTPTADDIRGMHAYIISAAGTRTGLAPGQISVLYGGSVNAVNAREILATEGVAGVLVGGASLKADEFCKIIASA